MEIPLREGVIWVVVQMDGIALNRPRMNADLRGFPNGIIAWHIALLRKGMQ